MSTAKSFIHETGQSTKIHIGIGAFVAMGGVLAYVMFHGRMSDAAVFASLTLIVCALGVGTWLCLTVRCPRCGVRILWLAVRSRPANDWFPWLISLTSCPKCLFAPTKDSQGYLKS